MDPHKPTREPAGHLRRFTSVLEAAQAINSIYASRPKHGARLQPLQDRLAAGEAVLAMVEGTGVDRDLLMVTVTTRRVLAASMSGEAASMLTEFPHEAITACRMTTRGWLRISTLVLRWRDNILTLEIAKENHAKAFAEMIHEVAGLEPDWRSSIPVIGGGDIETMADLDARLLNALEESIDEPTSTSIEFCLLGAGDQVLAALADHVVLVKPGSLAGAMGGHRAFSHLYSDINGIKINVRRSTGVIELLTTSFPAGVEKGYWSMRSSRDAFKAPNCLPISMHDLMKYEPYLERLRVRIRDTEQHPSLSDRVDATLGGLERLDALKRSGTLTDEEFVSLKRQLLDGDS